MEKHPTTAEEIESVDSIKGESTIAPPEDSGAGVLGAVVEMADEGLGHLEGYRWVICGLLFFATTVNYVDRSVLAVLSPLLQTKIGWTNTQYGNITAAFSAAYAVGLLFAGGIIDKIGVRRGYPLFMALWGLASISHVFVKTVFGFGVARIFLGLFESGNFPAAVKTTTEWFAKKERSLAIGVFNSGSNVGAIAAPIVVPAVVLAASRMTHDRISWQAAFCVTGIAEIIWIIFWLTKYRSPAEHLRRQKSFTVGDGVGVTPTPHGAKPVQRVSRVRWGQVFPYRQTWAFALGKFLTDPVWWFWLFWSAPYLHSKFNVNIKTVGLPLIIIYCMASVGSVGGGWISAVFVRAGMTMNMGRKLALLCCGLCVLPVMFAPFLNNEWGVVMLIGVAAAAHQGFSANLFALSGDLFPQRVVGSVVGIGGLFGGIAGIIVPLVAGRVVDRFHTYTPLFIFAGSAYLVAVLIIQILAPRLEQAKIDAALAGLPIVQP